MTGLQLEAAMYFSIKKPMSPLASPVSCSSMSVTFHGVCSVTGSARPQSCGSPRGPREAQAGRRATLCSKNAR